MPTSIFGAVAGEATSWILFYHLSFLLLFHSKPPIFSHPLKKTKKIICFHTPSPIYKKKHCTPP
jgi:hypothetical protein